MPKQKKMWDNALTVIMSLLSLLWIYPIVLILLNSLKIEGRMKTALYVATVARTYRRALDDYRQDPKLYEKNMPSTYNFPAVGRSSPPIIFRSVDLPLPDLPITAISSPFLIVSSSP